MGEAWPFTLPLPEIGVHMESGVHGVRGVLCTRTHSSLHPQPALRQPVGTVGF